VLNKRVLENFIKSGGFDWSGLSRAELLERYEEVLKIAQKSRADLLSNQMGLFASEVNDESRAYEPRRELLLEWPVNIRLAREKEALGFYLSGHPLEKYREELLRLGTITIADLRSRTDGSTVSVAGVVTAVKLKNTKKGDRYATFTLEDLLDTIEVIVWPDVYSKVQQILDSDDPVLLTARLDANDDRRQLIAQEIESALAIRERTAKEAVVRLAHAECSSVNLNKLKNY
jgi:DNA polymerase-3 subunit alpha